MLRCHKIALLLLVTSLVPGVAAARPKKKKHPAAAPVVAAPVVSPAPVVETAPPPAPVVVAPAPPPPLAPPPAAPTETPLDLEALAAEYNSLSDDLFRSRAKLELLGKALYQTKLSATLSYDAGRVWPLGKVTLVIDGEPVFSADAPNASNDALPLYDGFVAPGRHKVALHVDCTSVGGGNLTYAAEGQFTVETISDKTTLVRFTVDESGDGPQHLDQKKSGTFDVKVRADVKQLDKGK